VTGYAFASSSCIARAALKGTPMTDIILELRTLARLMENKAPVTFRAEDAAKLRKAADELEDLRAAMDQSAKLAYSAVRAEPAAILELIEAQRTDAHLYDGDYCLRTVAAAIKARGEK
jgi:hypothetical protein